MSAILWLAVGIILLVGYIRTLEQKSVFAPVKELAFTPAQINLLFEDVFIDSDHFKLHGWFILNPSAKSTLMFFHGNAGNIGDRLNKIYHFYQMGLNIFIFDYRGYGKSEGRPSEQGLYRDALAAYNYLTKERKILPKELVVYGASLGGAVAIDLTSQKETACLIVDSAFSSAADMAKVVHPFVPSFFIKVKLDSMKKVGDIRVPKLFIHSHEDEIVPFALGKKLFEAASEPKIFCAIQGSHNDGFVQDRERILGAMSNFLKKLELIPG